MRLQDYEAVYALGSLYWERLVGSSVNEPLCPPRGQRWRGVGILLLAGRSLYRLTRLAGASNVDVSNRFPIARIICSKIQQQSSLVCLRGLRLQRYKIFPMPCHQIVGERKK